MEAQRQRARAGSKIATEIFAGGPLTELKAKQTPATVFVGHEHPGLMSQGEVQGLIVDGTLADKAEQGQAVVVVLDETPFYGESGGQAGDRGLLRVSAGVVRVDDTQAQEGYHLHQGVVVEGAIEAGETASAIVDAARRSAIRRNHTATHLLHKVLKDVLGEHVQQEGSLVDADRLRFDFRHDQPVTNEQIHEIEGRINAWILENQGAETQVMDLDEAKASGAVAMFGEKYAGMVRVLDVPGPAGTTSRELCGGTHVLRTGDIGSFRVTTETGIAAGIRRMEAVTGLGAFDAFAGDRAVLRDLSQTLKVRPEELPERLGVLQDELKALRKQVEAAQRDAALGKVQALAEQAEQIGGLRVVIASLEGVDAKALKGIWDAMANADVAAAVLVGEQGGKAPLLAAAAPSAIERGVDARKLLKVAAGVLGGGGGGRPNVAQGQGQRRDQIPAALEAARQSLQEALS
jgi:alanyl-tRNA synthetase